MTGVIRVLSAGAVKGGVAQLCAAFEAETGNKVEVEFTQVPKMRKRIAAGEGADVLVATAGAMDAFAAAGKIVPATRALLGRSRVGVVVHRDATAPDMSDTEAFKRALLTASAVVHNDASSGVYIAALLEKLGLTAQLGNRIVVVNSGAAIITTVAEREPGAVDTNGAHGTHGAIGMGQISEIRVMIDKGVAAKFVAPLPDAIQNVSTYYAAAAAASAMPGVAAALVCELTSDAAKKVFAATGID
jgi:molybdate transport system substrate-binding protein